jgi:hypothetical protein
MPALISFSPCRHERNRSEHFLLVDVNEQVLLYVLHTPCSSALSTWRNNIYDPGLDADRPILVETGHVSDGCGRVAFRQP